MAFTYFSGYDPIPGNNFAAAPAGAPEGMPPGDVNDSLRQAMAAIAESHDAWIAYFANEADPTAPVPLPDQTNNALLDADQSFVGANIFEGITNTLLTTVTLFDTAPDITFIGDDGAAGTTVGIIGYNATAAIQSFIMDKALELPFLNLRFAAATDVLSVTDATSGFDLISMNLQATLFDIVGHDLAGTKVATNKITWDATAEVWGYNGAEFMTIAGGTFTGAVAINSTLAVTGLTTLNAAEAANWMTLFNTTDGVANLHFLNDANGPGFLPTDAAGASQAGDVLGYIQTDAEWVIGTNSIFHEGNYLTKAKIAYEAESGAYNVVAATHLAKFVEHSTAAVATLDVDATSGFAAGDRFDVFDLGAGSTVVMAASVTLHGKGQTGTATTLTLAAHEGGTFVHASAADTWIYFGEGEIA